MFPINSAPKFKYQPGHSKVKVQVMTTTEHLLLFDSFVVLTKQKQDTVHFAYINNSR